MRYIWEKVDVNAGRVFWSEHRPTNGKNMICYRYDKASGDKILSLISLDDGLIWQEFSSYDDLATFLTEKGYRPDSVVLPDRMVK